MIATLDLFHLGLLYLALLALILLDQAPIVTSLKTSTTLDHKSAPKKTQRLEAYGTVVK